MQKLFFSVFTENLSSIAAGGKSNNTIQTEGKGQRVQRQGGGPRVFKSEGQPLEGLLVENAELKTPGVAKESQGCDTEDPSHYHTSIGTATMGQDVQPRGFGQAEGHVLCWMALNRCVFESVLSAVPQGQGEASQPDSRDGKSSSGRFPSLGQGHVERGMMSTSALFTDI